jgi:hypothetical protein
MLKVKVVYNPDNIDINQDKLTKSIKTHTEFYTDQTPKLTLTEDLFEHTIKFFLNDPVTEDEILNLCEAIEIDNPGTGAYYI